MLNEFVYCPRLFYYEHVEGIFLHSEDTKRGASAHTRVDAGSGQLPPPAEVEKESPRAIPPEATPPTGGAGGPITEDSSAGVDPTPPQESAQPIPSETIHARSVMLGSQSLGVIAKLDLVEVTVEAAGDLFARQSVCPVEYKSGAPREGGDSKMLWDADRMQLGLQIQLLRENGYTCDEGVVYYRQTRQRVRYELTPEDETWIRRGIDAARACTAGPIPPPLDHSPKCPRCSLAPVCLPDETRHLLATPDPEIAPPLVQLALPGLALGPVEVDHTQLADLLETQDTGLMMLPELRQPRLPPEGGVRRLIAPDHDTKVLYINTPGVSLTRKGETVVVKEQGESLSEVRIKDLHHLAVFGPAQISTALIQTLCEREVPVSYFSMGGWFYGLTRGHGLTNVFTRIQQFARPDGAALRRAARRRPHAPGRAVCQPPRLPSRPHRRSRVQLRRHLWHHPVAAAAHDRRRRREGPGHGFR